MSLYLIPQFSFLNGCSLSILCNTVLRGHIGGCSIVFNGCGVGFIWFAMPAKSLEKRYLFRRHLQSFGFVGIEHARSIDI